MELWRGDRINSLAFDTCRITHSRIEGGVGGTGVSISVCWGTGLGVSVCWGTCVSISVCCGTAVGLDVGICVDIGSSQ